MIHLVLNRQVTRLLELLWVEPNFPTFPYKTWEIVYMRNKAGSTTRVTHPIRSPSYPANFSPYDHFGLRDNQSVCERSLEHRG